MERPDYQPARLVLGSASPRRKALLEQMGLEFEVRTQDTAETFSSHLKGHEITDYLSKVKADALYPTLSQGQVLLTADTIVWKDGAVLEKPGSKSEAAEILNLISGEWHEVITSVCFTLPGQMQTVAHEITRVKFALLDEGMIRHYLEIGHPLDKAGAYGIQEWIGLVGVEQLQGSYTNVVGLPTRLVYKTLRDIVESGF